MCKSFIGAFSFVLKNGSVWPFHIPYCQASQNNEKNVGVENNAVPFDDSCHQDMPVTVQGVPDEITWTDCVVSLSITQH